MQLLAVFGHSGFVLESMFLEFFKMGIFTTRIHLFLEKQLNLFEEKHSFRPF